MSKSTKMRVVIPRNPADLLALSASVYAKHQQDGSSSPLQNMQENDWAVDGPKIAAAQALHAQAEDLKLQMEKAYRDRDLLLSSIKETLLASRDILTGVCRNNMKRMGDWGFSIDDSPRAKKPVQP